MVTAAPESGALFKAYQFCQSALLLQHTISLIFFYFESVRLLTKPDVLTFWITLQHTHHLSYHFCSTSVAQEGIPMPLPALFTVSGLGVWSESIGQADRIMLFKGAE